MPKYKPMPPLERLNELFKVVEIPPDKFGEWSGLVRKIHRGGQRVGSEAGTPQRSLRDGRIDWRVKIHGEDYLVSRVIYYMTHKENFDDVQVDHRDQNPLNNNVDNLRLDIHKTTQSVNKSIYKNNTSGVVGVSRYGSKKKWRATVVICRKSKLIGVFTCKVEAACAVNDKWIELGWDKLGRKLNDLENIECNCESCMRAASS